MPTDDDNSQLSGLDPEFARVLRIGDPGMALDGALTFLPPSAAPRTGWLDAWRGWMEGTFALTLGPCLSAAAAHAERGAARELHALDLALDACFPDDAARARSAAAGRRLLRRLANARGERWFDKFQTWAAAGETPAHFCVVFAGQGAIFHLSRRLLLPGYAYWEWCAAMNARPPVDRPLPVFAREWRGQPLPTDADAPSTFSVFHAAKT